MKLFKKDQAPSRAEAPAEPVKTVGKGRATPKRKDAQARRLHPIVPADRKAARREARAKRDEAWERQRRAMITGDERYLPARDKGHIRRYIRDYIDALCCFMAGMFCHSDARRRGSSGGQKI